MTAPASPTLTSASVLSVSREGGVAHFPGLARPRRMACAGLSDVQRERLESLLGQAASDTLSAPAGSADQRTFHLQVEEVEGRVCWSLDVAETLAPEWLITLWRHGEWPGRH